MSVGDMHPALVAGTSRMLRADRRRVRAVPVGALATLELLVLASANVGLWLGLKPTAGLLAIDQTIVAFGSVVFYGLLAVCVLAFPETGSRVQIRLLRPLLTWAAAITLVGGILLLTGSALEPALPLLGAFAALGSAVIGFGRSSARALVAEGYLATQPRHRALIFGADTAGSSYAERLAESPGDIEVVGFIDDRTTRVRDGLALPILGKTADVRELIDRYDVSRVLIALPRSAKSRIRTVSDQLQVLPISVFLALEGDADNSTWSSGPSQQMGGMAVAKLSDWPLSSRFNWFLKSAEDKIGALLLIILFGPLMLMIALAIKLDSPGPVLYRQTRSGFNGRPFGVYKFRTMHMDQCDASDSRQTVRGDPRVTRLGRLLRRYSVDELPQIFNALNGTMSLVGPRPHPVNMQCAGRYVSQFVDNYMARNRMRPGITGLAQINGWRGIVDSEAHMQARMRYDLAYIDNWSIWLDLRILSRSFLKGWRDPGAV